MAQETLFSRDCSQARLRCWWYWPRWLGRHLCAGLTIFNGLRNSKARPGELVAIQGVGGSVTSAFSLRGAWAFKSRPLLADQKRKVSPGSLGHITTLITMLKIQLPHFKPWVAPD